MSTESVDTYVVETEEEWLVEEEWQIPEAWVVPEKTSAKAHIISPPQCYMHTHFNTKFSFWYYKKVICC